ncbi:hypothetical protein [Pigmentiphaga litoralis]|uniref:hypothetical protein n=1 Tax=Pigmentiphaga litoralis TaxID=516702 RepID=UPI003B430BF6
MSALPASSLTGLPEGTRPRADPPAKLWYTRCAVPTASGIAYDQGWLSSLYANEGVEIGILQDAPLDIARHHYDHDLPGLIREGGNVPAIVARAAGAPTRLVGLTWIDERQAIVVRDNDPQRGASLKGRRMAVPGWAAERHASHQRAMALAGFASALAHQGLSLDDVVHVDLPVGATIPRDICASADPRASGRAYMPSPTDVRTRPTSRGLRPSRRRALRAWWSRSNSINCPIAASGSTTAPRGP